METRQNLMETFSPATPTTITSNPLTLRTISNPNPTTFILADTSSFKQVVQMHTGSATMQAAVPPQKNPIPPAPKRPAFKLYERRRSFRQLSKISPLLPSSRKRPGTLSPSALDLSPVTHLVHGPFNRGPPSLSSSPSPMSEEERAIAAKGYYFHPSPLSAPEPPRLLPLFPLTSPRTCSAAAVSAP